MTFLYSSPANATTTCTVTSVPHKGGVERGLILMLLDIGEYQYVKNVTTTSKVLDTVSQTERQIMYIVVHVIGVPKQK